MSEHVDNIGYRVHAKRNLSIHSKHENIRFSDLATNWALLAAVTVCEPFAETIVATPVLQIAQKRR